MNFDWDTTPIVVNRDGAIFTININSDVVHSRITDFIVSGINQDFIKNLVEAWNNPDIPIIRVDETCITCKPSSLSQSRRPTFAGFALQ
jgi:hypothetical protein